MPREIILHIGLMKTGTSSIQRVLAGHRAELAARGIAYPRSPGNANHGLLPASLVPDQMRIGHVNPAVWEGVAPERRIAQFRRDFAQEMAALPPATTRIVFSAEQMSGWLIEDASIAALRDLLAPHAQGFRVIVYLRRQDSLAASAYNQNLRVGGLQPPSLRGSAPPFYDYAALLERWSRIFGEDAVVPRIFERAAMQGGDVVEDFLAVAGIDLAVAPDDPGRESNQSIGLAGQALMRAVGEVVAREAGDGPIDGPVWRRFAQTVTDAVPGKGWRPPRGEAAAFLARYADGNEAVRRRWFADRASLFSADLADLPETEIVPTPGEMLDAACKVLVREFREGVQREVVALLQQARLQRLLGDAAAARALLLRAVQRDAHHLQARLKLVEVLIEQGALDLAREHLGIAAARAPEDEGVLRWSRRLRKATELA